MVVIEKGDSTGTSRFCTGNTCQEGEALHARSQETLKDYHQGKMAGVRGNSDIHE